MKYKIEKIKLTMEQQEEVDKILKGETVEVTYHYKGARGHIIERTRSKKLTGEMAKRRLTQLLGGQCLCGFAWPDYRVVYDVSSKTQSAKRIERYCEPCFQKRGFKL